jgi:hypothetical protein
MLNLKRIGAVNVLAALAMVTACEQQTGRNYASKFDPDLERQEQVQLLQTQKAAGAYADATLYADHFDAAGLSSLGKEKLDLMLADGHAKSPLAVYLQIPNDAQAAARQVAVSHYLMDKGGLKSSQILITLGVNPDNTYPVGDSMKNYDKTDTAGDIGSAGGSSSSGSSSGH